MTQETADGTNFPFTNWAEESGLTPPDFLQDPDVCRALEETVSSSHAFGNRFFPDAFGASHELEKELSRALDNGHRRVVICAPRGLGKTTRTLLGFCARRICWRLNKFMIYTTNTAENAEFQTEALKNALRASNQIKAFFGPPELRDAQDLPPQFSKRSWCAYGTTVVPRGAGQQFRGLLSNFARPDLFVFDDLESRELVRSDVQRDKLRTWFFSDVLRCVSVYDKTAIMIYIDTLKHEGSLLKFLLNDPEWYSIHLSAFRGVPNTADEVESACDGYMTTSELRKLFLQFQRAGKLSSYYMEFGGVIKGEDSESFRQIDFRHAVEDPVTGTLSILTPEYEEHRRNPETKMLPFAGEKYLPDPLKLNTMGSLVLGDPAKTEKSTRAQNCVLGVSFPPDLSLLVVRRVWAAKGLPSNFFEKIFEMVKELSALWLGVEHTGLGDYLNEPIRNEIARLELPLEFTPMDASAAKEERVKMLIPWYKSGTMIHVIGQCEGLETQLMDFPYAALWDMMDALAHLPQLLEKSGLSGKAALTRLHSAASKKDEFFDEPDIYNQPYMGLTEDEASYPWQI